RRQSPLRPARQAGDLAGLHVQGPDPRGRQRMVRRQRGDHERRDGRRALRDRRQQRRHRRPATLLDRRRRPRARPAALRPGGLMATEARLLVSCPDRPGIIAAISRFLYEREANIVSSDQHSTDPEGGLFFLRMEFIVDRLTVSREALEREFAAEVAEPLGMSWRLRFLDQVPRVAIMVSREDHCLLDLLWRWRRAELDCQIGLVVSNHPDLRADVEGFGLPYEHVPVERGRKPEAEARQLELLAGRFDLVVLARYMQILSGDFLER